MNKLVAQSPTFIPTSAMSHAMNTWAIAPKRLLRILPAQIRASGACVRKNGQRHVYEDERGAGHKNKDDCAHGPLGGTELPE
jgi:hypothetical protein